MYIYNDEYEYNDYHDNTKACKGDMGKMSKAVWWIGGYFDADGSKTWRWTGSQEEIQNAEGFAAKGKNNRWNDWKVIDLRHA